MNTSIQILIFLAVAAWKHVERIIKFVDDQFFLRELANVYATPRTHYTKMPRPLYSMEETLAMVTMFATYCPHGMRRGKCKRCKKPGAQP